MLPRHTYCVLDARNLLKAACKEFPDLNWVKRREGISDAPN